MTNIKERVLQIAENEGIAKEKFFSDLGLTYGNFTGNSKKSDLKSSSIGKIILKYDNYNPIWLITGNGAMYKKEESTVSEPKESYMKTDITGYYYPEVSASAGLNVALENVEVIKKPIIIPNWGNGIDFINVYGDSMYPKYCSGEIIGIKEIEPQYLNYGYAYVVIMNDGEVYLKYIKKGKDEKHWILESENKKYEPKEFDISMIRKVFIVKGVITKTMM